MIHTTTILRERNIYDDDVECEVAVEVEYTYHRAHRGARDSLGGKPGAGPPIEPDEPAEVEIESVRDSVSGSDLELTNAETDKIRDEIWKAISDQN